MRRREQVMKVEFVDQDDNLHIAYYDRFYINNKTANYHINVDGYRSDDSFNAKDAFSHYHMFDFVTPDTDEFAKDIGSAGW